MEVNELLVKLSVSRIATAIVEDRMLQSGQFLPVAALLSRPTYNRNVAYIVKFIKHLGLSRICIKFC